MIGPREIDEENRYLRQRQQNFRLAAEHVAREFALIPSVQKVVLFGSVAAKLRQEVPRFREFRREGIELLHECMDVDLAVWVSDLKCLRVLQKAVARGLDRLLAEKNIGFAHHQVDVFIMEPGSDRYRGRLCKYASCPKKGKPECLVTGCGAARLLRLHEGFAFDPNALKAEGVAVLFERVKDRTGDQASAEETDKEQS